MEEKKSITKKTSTLLFINKDKEPLFSKRNVAAEPTRGTSMAKASPLVLPP